jgi:hypothetical protein
MYDFSQDEVRYIRIDFEVIIMISDCGLWIADLFYVDRVTLIHIHFLQSEIENPKSAIINFPSYYSKKAKT